MNVAIIGLRGHNTGHPTWTERGRGLDHYEHLAGIKNVRITHVVDIDERHFGTSLPYAKDKWGGDPKTETDFRRVLDNRDVDAVTIAAPDHWHALMTILACQAGKDVYVEKPISHNIVEGRRMIEAARRSNRVVQVGTQARSGRAAGQSRPVRARWRTRNLYMGKTVINRPRDPIGVAADGQVPPGVHYDLWMGPAPEHPFNEHRFHYYWHWFWDYGTGDLGNTAVHTLDATRWLLGKQEHPRTVYCSGGTYEDGAPTDQQTPNTQSATYRLRGRDGAALRPAELVQWTTGGAGRFRLRLQGLDEGRQRQGRGVLRTARSEAGADADQRREARFGTGSRGTGALRELHRGRPVASVGHRCMPRSRRAICRRPSATWATSRIEWDGR